MNFIIQWIYKTLMETLGDVVLLITSVSSNLFKHSVVSKILSLGKAIGISLWAIGALVLLQRLAIQLADGESIKISDTIKRFILSAVIAMYGSDLTIGAYKIFNEFSDDIASFISNGTSLTFEFSLNVGNTAENVSNVALQVIILAIVMYFVIKVVIDLTKRFWYIFVQIFTMYFSNTEFMMGNDGAIGTWFKTTMSVMLTQVFQILILCIGINYLVSSSGVVDVMLAFGAIAASAHVEEMLDKWGRSVSGRAGSFMNTVTSTTHAATSIYQVVSRIK